jgi:hypothetical protein
VVPVSDEKKCKNCDRPILMFRYGAGWRWEHYTIISGVTTPMGVFCRSNKAEPKGPWRD